MARRQMALSNIPRKAEAELALMSLEQQLTEARDGLSRASAKSLKGAREFVYCFPFSFLKLLARASSENNCSDISYGCDERT